MVREILRAHGYELIAVTRESLTFARGDEVFTLPRVEMLLTGLVADVALHHGYEDLFGAVTGTTGFPSRPTQAAPPALR
jgi:hypothetical protein